MANAQTQTTVKPNALRQLVRRAMAAALPRRLFMTSGPRNSGEVALTFDDGPDPVNTPVILDRLRDLGVHATFFVVGKKAAEHPELVRRIAEEGHEVGDHSYTHAPPPETSMLALLGEVRRTGALIARLAGRVPHLFRPPHGKLTPAKLLALWLARQTVVLWSKDPKDFASKSPDEVRAWLARTPLAAGDIVLLHDVQPNTAPVLDALFAKAHDAGLRFVTIDKWAA